MKTLLFRTLVRLKDDALNILRLNILYLNEHFISKFVVIFKFGMSPSETIEFHFVWLCILVKAS